MKKLKFSILLLFIYGCMGRELFKVDSTNTHLTENGFVYENDTVKITYNFWAENGIMGIDIYNKLTVPIFIDWKVSNFINNGINLQYWYDTESSTSINKGVNYYGLRTFTGIPVSVHSGITHTNTERPDRIVSITPHSNIIKSPYSLLADNINIVPANYTFNNSPIKFRNYLVFSTDESFTKKFYVDNQFYISSAEMIKQTQFKESGNGISYQSSDHFFSKRMDYEEPVILQKITFNNGDIVIGTIQEKDNLHVNITKQDGKVSIVPKDMIKSKEPMN